MNYKLISNSQFEVLSNILKRKTKPEMVKAAKDVFVLGISQKDAAKKNEVSASSLNRYIQSLKELESKIIAYNKCFIK